MMKFTIYSFISFLLAGCVHERRPQAKIIPDVHSGEYIFKVDNTEPSEMGYLHIFRETDGVFLDKKRIYSVKIIPLLEADSQWVFFEDMFEGGGEALYLKNEKGNAFKYNILSGKVSKISPEEYLTAKKKEK